MVHNSTNQGVKANNTSKELCRLGGREARYHRASRVALQESYCGAKGIARFDAKDAWSALWRRVGDILVCDAICRTCKHQSHLS